MQVDWIHLLWQARWDGIVLIWNAILIDAQTYWWFAPLLVVIAAVAGKKGVVRLLSYVARVFVHTHGS